MPNRICIIPAKGTSTRLPRKNALPLDGHSLIAHAIRKAIKLELFERIVVSTEDEQIAQIAADYGAEVPYMRPPELSVDPASIANVCVHMLDWLRDKEGAEFDTLVLMLATSPLVILDDIRGAIADFDAHGGRGCLLGVCQMDQPPFSTQLMDEDGRLRPAFPDSPYVDKKSNECPPTYHSNGCVAVVQTDWMKANQSFYGPGTRGYVMPRSRSIDIDTREEYDLAVALYGMDATQRDVGLF